MRIKIDIEEDIKSFVITGDIANVIKNRGSYIFLKSNFHAKFFVNKIVIEYVDDKREELLNRIRRFFKHNGLEEETSTNIKDVLQKYFKEEENFKNFSKRALNIRNNITDSKEFAEFTNVLKKQMRNRKLYPLQLLSAYHMAFSQNSCNFSVPGSGKTSIVFGAYSYLKSLANDSSKRVECMFIVGPLSSFGPWEDEFEACFGVKPNCVRLSGISKSRRKHYLSLSTPPEMVLSSYQGIVNNNTEITSYLRKHKVMVVLDEAHKIKNIQGGVTAESTLSLAEHASSRIILTGTPAPNGYEDLYNLFKFIWPSKNIIGFRINQLKAMSIGRKSQRIEGLINNVSPFFIRIRKRDLKLPKPIENPPIVVKMGKVQREIYDEIANKYIDYFRRINTKESIRSYLVRARMIRLMQVATNVNLLKYSLENFFSKDGKVPNNLFVEDLALLRTITEYKNIEIPSKFYVALEIINRVLGLDGKIVVWSNYISNIEDFHSFLNDNNIKSKVIYGKTPVESDSLSREIETREIIIREFNDNESKLKVLIANPFAVAESVSLHKACHNALYLDRTFNATHLIQSKDRIHRFGLKEDDVINYYYLVSDSSVDETIHNRLITKEKRMLEVIESQEIPLLNLNMDYETDDPDDLKEIIKDYVRKNN